MKMLSFVCLDVCILNSILMLVKFGDNRSMVERLSLLLFFLKQVLAFTKVSA